MREKLYCPICRGLLKRITHALVDGDLSFTYVCKHCGLSWVFLPSKLREGGRP